jgi:cyclic beta-1,2-glucan synthetase
MGSISPCIPSDWPGFHVTLRRGTTRYDVSVENPAGCCQGIGQAELDGVGMDSAGGLLVVPLDGGIHRLRIVLERTALAA